MGLTPLTIEIFERNPIDLENKINNCIVLVFTVDSVTLLLYKFSILQIICLKLFGRLL